MSSSHRKRYHSAWPNLTAPLRPDPEVVSAVAAEIARQPGRALLLGVTPELAGIAPDLVAIDRNLNMVENVWPGNSVGRNAVVGEWTNANFRASSFAVAVGDGSLNSVRFPDEVLRVSAELRRLLEPGGTFVCRLYMSEPTDRIADVAAAALAGRFRNFHAFKMHLAMAIAVETGDPNVRVQILLDTITTLFPDRAELVRATGWDRAHVDTIDFYRNSSAATSYPTQDQWRATLAAVFSGIRFAPSGRYELAERCPLLVATCG